MHLVNIAYKPKPLYRLPRAATQTANHANSTSPSAASLSNTVPGYTTLGGRWAFAAPLGAATDFALFGYTVPTTHRLILDGIDISAMNTGAAVATTATVLDWFLGLNSAGVSLAGADVLRYPLGMQGFIIAAAIGQSAPDICRKFKSPLQIEPGKSVILGVQVPIGTNTGSQVMRGDAMFSGWFEPADDILSGG